MLARLEIVVYRVRDRVRAGIGRDFPRNFSRLSGEECPTALLRLSEAENRQTVSVARVVGGA
jgi:hypothetical protein